MRRGWIAALALLAACAGPELRWAKPGASPEQAAADAASCRTQARATVNQALGPDVDRLNLMGAPPTLTGQSSNILQSMQRDQLADIGHRREEQETVACMRAKGYAQR
jgi:hypothetical protein